MGAAHRAATLLALAAAAGVRGLPPRRAVVASLQAAHQYFIANPSAFDEHCDKNTHLCCKWTRSTYMLGHMALFRVLNASGDTDGAAAMLRYAHDWAEANKWQLCGPAKEPEVARYPPGPKPIKPRGHDDADNGLCGATYADLYMIDGGRNETYIADTSKTILAQVANKTARNLWSWIDAIHMGMNAYVTLASATHNAAILEGMFEMYDVTANQGDPPDGVNTFHMWDEAQSLFYRDDRFLGTGVFWGRGNGWAMAAMASVLSQLPAADPHRAEYEGKLTKMAAALLPLQGSDGCWRASLLNASGYPAPETTGSGCFTYAIAYGIKAGLLPAQTYMAPLERAWACLSSVALQPSGRYGYCQPVGGSPASTDANATSDFCVGQFLLAGAAVAELAMAA